MDMPQEGFGQYFLKIGLLFEKKIVEQGRKIEKFRKFQIIVENTTHLKCSKTLSRF